MTQIHITIKGQPIPLERARHGKGRTYDTARNISAKSAMGWQAKVAMGGRKPLEGAVRVRFAFLFDWPKSYTKKRKEMCYGNMKDTKPDIDNLCKLVMDALNGIAWIDDAQVCEIHATKFFSETGAQTRITIENLWEQDA